jgi:DNA invertase Pin-like site-specific DNA recombinase
MSPTREEIRKMVEERIRELRPVIEELQQLQAILSLLEGSEAGQEAGDSDSAALTALLAQAGIDTDVNSRQPIRRSRRGTKPGRDGRAPQGANKQRIIEAVMHDPGVTATEIAERTGVKRTVVSATINRLKRNGELEPLGQGVRVPSGRRLAALAQ